MRVVSNKRRVVSVNLEYMQRSAQNSPFSFCICQAIKPKINDQLSQDENLENSLKMANARPVEAMTFTGAGNSNERG